MSLRRQEWGTGIPRRVGSGHQARRSRHSRISVIVLQSLCEGFHLIGHGVTYRRRSVALPADQGTERVKDRVRVDVITPLPHAAQFVALLLLINLPRHDRFRNLLQVPVLWKSINFDATRTTFSSSKFCNGAGVKY